ncbi:unnamed protein product [Vitrella brassicaformis CCMP3155]|uniref:Uncharacterized protein n=1 Tax=Vitrella brassicaformis (strain CCMP3155) TaxID=1169540 RepID=A0A0G4EHB7_VITBC|nr:unnamed protein product [Vitrella brassicaformis CCMP3155]|eukprot:CEL95886.1 unnamed protein product [Vitrella brassicaformis CCMP3155]
MQQQIDHTMRDMNYAKLTAQEAAGNRKRQREAVEMMDNLLPPEERDAGVRKCPRLMEKRLLGEMGSYVGVTAQEADRRRSRQRRRVAVAGRRR